MSRGRFEYQWVPFVNVPKHTIDNEDLVCMTQSGTLHLCVFENECFKTLDGALITNVVFYQNDPHFACAMREAERFRKESGK